MTTTGSTTGPTTDSKTGAATGSAEGAVLVMDSCGEGAAVGMAVDGVLKARRELGVGRGSVEIVSAIRDLLDEARLPLAELRAVAVVAGPGSFTGVRVGMATAKGLCEPTGMRMIGVSRLEVMAEAAGGEAWVALDAGRGEVYARTPTRPPREWLASDAEMQDAAAEHKVVVCEQRLVDRIAGAEWLAMGLEDVLKTALRRMQSMDGDDLWMDANYVRREADIYKTGKKTGNAGSTGTAGAAGAGAASAGGETGKSA